MTNIPSLAEIFWLQRVTAVTAMEVLRSQASMQPAGNEAGARQNARQPSDVVA